MEELKARKHDMREERDVKSREEVRQTLIARQAQRALPLSGTADAPAVRADDVPIVLSVPGSQPSGQKVWGKGYGVLGRSAPRSDLDRMIAKVRVQR